MANRNTNTKVHANATLASLGAFDACAWMQQPHGTFLVENGCARDHVEMRAAQLSSLLRLVHMDGSAPFDRLAADAKNDITWLACQLADEVQLMLPILAAEVAATSEVSK